MYDWNVCPLTGLECVSSEFQSQDLVIFMNFGCFPVLMSGNFWVLITTISQLIGTADCGKGGAQC